MAEWHEFRLWYAINPNPSDIFAFKKAHLLPMLERYGVEDFLMLDEPEFVLLRIDINGESAKRIYCDLEKTTRPEPLFSKVTVESWSPTEDARNRILTARQRAKIPAGIPQGGWRITGKTPDGKWGAAPEDLDKQIAAFSIFISKVVGKFTKAYLKQMPYRVEDRWLMSVFLHLILDSISTWQKEEEESRDFPYV